MMPPRDYLLAPARSVVGQEAVSCLPDVVAERGRRCLIVADGGGVDAAAAPLATLGRRFDVTTRPFEGECTEAAIARICVDADRHDVLLGVGGGKALDAAKAAAALARIPCITLPTSAATCAAYTPLSILHREDGAYVESRRLRVPVFAMIVDPDLIVSAPPRLLAAGIVDGLARALDTLLAAQIDVPTTAAAVSVAVSRAILEDGLLRLGTQALADNARGKPTDTFMRVVEACIVGAGLAGETGARFFGRSFSHSVGYALSHVVDPNVVLHGEAVGLGVLVHCALDSRSPIPFDRMVDLFAEWDVPASFAALGVSAPDASLVPLADRALAYLDVERAVPFPIEVGDLLREMRRIEATANSN